MSPKEHIAEFMHAMGEAENAFRMIVIKKNITPVLPGIDAYFSKETKEQLHKEMYYTIATNDFELSTQEILALHRQRGETSETQPLCTKST